LVNAKTRTKKNNKKNVPSFARGSSPMALQTTSRPSTNAVRVRPSDEDEEEEFYHVGSFQMKESTSSLADHLATLSSSEKGNEFVDRLLQEQELEDSATASTVSTTSAATSLVLTVLGGSALLLLIPQLLSTSSISAVATMGQDLWKAAQLALSVNWLPWMWIRASSTATATSDLVAYVQLFAKVELLEYLWLHIAPLSYQTFRKMFVAELWNRFWAATFRKVGLLFPPPAPPPSSSSSSSSNKKQPEPPPTALPAWLVDSHSFLVGTIQRGTKKIFRTTLQKKMQEAIDYALQATYTTACDQHFLVCNL
jgi:hypothetical protein